MFEIRALRRSALDGQIARMLPQDNIGIGATRVGVRGKAKLAGFVALRQFGSEIATVILGKVRRRTIFFSVERPDGRRRR